MIQFVLLTLVGLVTAMGSFGVWVVIGDSGKRNLGRRARRFQSPLRLRQRDSAIVPTLRRETLTVLDTLVQRILPRSASLRTRLQASGTGWSMGRYGIICVAVTVVATVLLAMRSVGLPTALGAGCVAGLWLPHKLVGNLIKRRQAKFSKFFPEAIGLIVRGLKAGLPVTETILVVGREVSDPVGEEFRVMADQIKLGQRVEDAMWAVARRLDLAEFNFLVITMSVQRETGGNLGETLQNLDEILRKRQYMRLKVKAMSSEAVASACIIGALPFIMGGILFLVSTSYIMTLFTTSLGLVLAAIAVISLLFGVFVMARMVRFEI